MSTEFVKNVQKWVAIDTQLHDFYEKIKKLRELKKEVADIIHTHVDENHMQKMVIHISDGELKFCEKKEYHTLTLNFIEKCLNECLHQDKEQVANIMNYIKSNRSVKTVKEISRNYTKTKE